MRVGRMLGVAAAISAMSLAGVVALESAQHSPGPRRRAHSRPRGDETPHPDEASALRAMRRYHRAVWAFEREGRPICGHIIRNATAAARQLGMALEARR